MINETSRGILGISSNNKNVGVKMANNPFSNLFNNADKFFDVLNLGRLIFYTAAGFLAIYPIYMILKLLTLSDNQTDNFFESFGVVVSNNSTSNHLLILFYASLVAGFLIATVGYTVFIIPLATKIHKKNKNIPQFKNTFSYNYPLLKNNLKNKEDYQAWLISEFFRYVELAVYLPMGFIIGLIFLIGYTVLYPFYKGIEQLSMTDLRNVLGFLLFLCMLITLLLFYVWPRFWRPFVLEKTLLTYLSAKNSLIKGVNDYEDKNAS